MNRILLTGTVAALAALSAIAQPPPPPYGGFGGPHFFFMGFGPEMSTPVTGAPYAAVQTTQFTQKLADGNVIQHNQQANVYRDAQGRVRIEHRFSGNATTISIFDPVAGFNYMLQPDKLTATKFPVRTPGAGPSGRAFRPEHRRPASEPPPQTDNLGTQTINGLLATGTRTTQTIPAGAIGNSQPIQVVREVWTSQDLKVPVLIKTSDPRFGDTTMQLTNVSQANPDPSLFQVPSNYTIQTGPERFGHMGRPPGNNANH